MSDQPTKKNQSLMVADDRTRRRNAAEKRFQAFGLAAIVIAVLALSVLTVSILKNGSSAFQQTFVSISVYVDPRIADPKGNRKIQEMSKVTTLGYGKLLKAGMTETLKDAGIDAGSLKAKDIAAILSKEAPAQLRAMVLANPSLIGTRVSFKTYANGRVDGFFKGRMTMEIAERDSKISPEQLQLAATMEEEGLIVKSFNIGFLTDPDASELRPEAAGLGVAILGSVYMMLVVLILALPIGVASAIYLEEFAPQNRWTDIIEVSISNLAAVPSIVFGILGLAAFINFAGLPQSAPIVGGLVLTLMTLPRLIIPARAALKSVPPSIRDAALGVGASRMQTVMHHVLPLAAPGILTGLIIGLGQALGETAPLLLIGMVAFVRDYPAAPPEGLFDPAAALPVQIYNWTQRADPAFVERASGAIIVLMVLLVVMNAAAIYLRRKFERRW